MLPAAPLHRHPEIPAGWLQPSCGFGTLDMTEHSTRRPGEALFALFIAGLSLFLLWSAYGISGFEALSGPGAVPMAAAATMLITAGIVLVQTLRATPAAGESIRSEILPGPVVVTILMVALYAALLQPLGFLPTSLLFLLVLIRILSGRSVIFCAGVSALSVLLIYLVFRIVFGVLMPEGIVPERDILAAIGRLAGGR